MATRLLVDGRALDDRYHGIGRVVSAVLPELAAREDLAVTVALGTGQRSERFDLTGLTRGLGFDTVEMPHGLDSVRQFAAWPGVQRAARAEVALFPYNLGAALSGPARRFTIVHDCIIETDPAFSPDRRTAVLYKLLTSVVVRRNTVLTPSRASAAAVRRHYRVGVDDDHVLTWGVGSEFAADAAAVTQIDGVPLPDRFLLHVGARRPHKNVAVLVRALAELPEQYGLVLVGSVDARLPDPVPALARELGVADRVVHLAGITDAQLRGLYGGAEAFVYPSFVEGVGLPLLEAMAAGTPVIASDIPVFREVAGDCVVYADPNSPNSWRDAVDIVARRRVEMVGRGRVRAAEATWSATAERLVTLLTT